MKENDFTQPIARHGEPIFASIIRNRSGIDAGEIDYAYRSPKKIFCDQDKEDIATTALLLYESISRDMGENGSPEIIKRIKKQWEEGDE